jgi:hypothetical protein
VIPNLDQETGNLPPGVHQASWEEITSRFGHTPHRRRLLEGLKAVLLALKAAGCRQAYVDGSFVTAKEHPGDFDGCWEVDGVDVALLKRIAPTLLDFRDRRKAQKAAYGGEMFLAHTPADPFGTAFVDFFQRDKHTGEPKGIIAIDLRDFT